MSIATQQAVLHTNKGDIVIDLFGNHAPKTVANFVELAEGKREFTDPQSGQQVTRPFYDGLGFHRIIKQFMIQGGCPLGTGTGGPGYVFDDEIHPELQFSKPYLLAMANAGKQMGRGTNGSQFFISTVETPWLNGKHTIFGEVADEDSKKVVDAIEAVPTGQADRPTEPVVIESVEIR
ncbi:peptidylprolyl isomerase [Brevibacterium luteolum]|uniref:peptidylprolyl isomerase n=1 Tax=Brevibacterium luteolum TaxID=199591 RepID=UPI00223AD1C3|nr:peptidylprolyl isomerase [Brevibacterium luteolum]MCT1873728.1 peptidylprolyl isomerase [Brevibacterium luteolum]MCT1891160.1 peptidylprolyl isomerase [Brevibacterium luteolum]MCT1893655.1 peptidylprolyl isomerase [Brevibacterium luteolum]MCT1924449.1 peptidylprolyl isomerase [Brevibacterium luteolum]